MRIWIAAIGSRPRDAFQQLAEMYLGRIAPYLGGAKALDAPVFRSEAALWEAIDRERARTSALVVQLDERARPMDSETFAAWLGRERDAGRQLLIFAIGPPDGWATAPAAAQKAAPPRDGEAPPPLRMQLSLGPMTLPHELARVVLAEQVYRALTILKGHPYHRS